MSHHPLPPHMSLPPLLAFCIAGVFCCSLLALHLLWLATLHRRSRPTVVSGHWGFAATLAGLGGFLIVLRSVVAAAGRTALSGRASDTWDAAWSRVVGGDAAGDAAGIVVGGFVVAAAAVAAWRRRDSLEVHHIDSIAVPVVAGEAAVAVGLAGASPSVSWTLRPTAGHATVRVRRLDPTLANELLRVLSVRMTEAPTPATSAGGWYTAAACGLLGCTLALFVTFYLLTRTI